MRIEKITRLVPFMKIKNRYDIHFQIVRRFW